MFIKKASLIGAALCGIFADTAFAQSNVWLIGEIAPLTGPGATVGSRI